MRGAVLGLMLALSACSFDLVGSHPGSFEFDARGAQHGQYFEQPEVTVQGEAGRIVVHALLSAASPCHALAGELQRSGSDLKLQVTVTQVGDACVASIGTFEYDAVIRDLAPGSYRLQVVHSYAECCWPTVTAYDRTVQVQ